MATAYKILGQSNPAAATLTDLYTVPAVTKTVVSTITIANRSATPTAFRISLAIAGAADAVQQYIAYDAAIGANEFITLTIGVALATTDKIRVYATLATLSFNAFGAEIT